VTILSCGQGLRDDLPSTLRITSLMSDPARSGIFLFLQAEQLLSQLGPPCQQCARSCRQNPRVVILRHLGFDERSMAEDPLKHIIKIMGNTAASVPMASILCCLKKLLTYLFLFPFFFNALKFRSYHLSYRLKHLDIRVAELPFFSKALIIR